MRLQEDSDITIVLNQPNFKVLHLPEEEHSVEVGFRVLMDIETEIFKAKDVVDALDPQRRALSTSVPVVPDFVDHLFPGLSEPVYIPVSESQLAFVIAHVPCEQNRQVISDQ